MVKSGIYIIGSIRDARCYIGSSVDAMARIKGHIRELCKGTHQNPRLRNFVGRYGIGSLYFAVLIYCDSDLLIEIEQSFIDSLSPAFNISPTAGSVFGIKRTAEQIETMRQRLLGKRNLGVSEANRLRRGRWIFPESGKRKISLANKGRARPDVAEKNKSMKGKIHLNIETKTKISNALKGKPLSELHLQVLKRTGRLARMAFADKMNECEVGNKYGMLTVIAAEFKKKYAKPRTWMKCRCNCGNVCDVLLYRLKIGNQISCGCARRSR